MNTNESLEELRDRLDRLISTHNEMATAFHERIETLEYRGPMIDLSAQLLHNRIDEVSERLKSLEAPSWPKPIAKRKKATGCECANQCPILFDDFPTNEIPLADQVREKIRQQQEETRKRSEEGKGFYE